jgi:hypothetical protein
MTDLGNDVIRDTIADIRLSRGLIAAGINKDENQRYEQQCTRELQALLGVRHNMKMDQYGWPVVLKET